MIHPVRTRCPSRFVTNEKAWRRPIGRGLGTPRTTSLAPASECQHPSSPTARALRCPPSLLGRTVVKKYHAAEPSPATAGAYLVVRSSGSAAYTSASWTNRHRFLPDSTWRRRYLVTSSWSVGWDQKSPLGSSSSGREEEEEAAIGRMAAIDLGSGGDAMERRERRAGGAAPRRVGEGGMVEPSGGVVPRLYGARVTRRIPRVRVGVGS
uniref:Uncharacterized protein n=1 Tax=Oryza brachyantha TaxID=4533 RepID=J3L2U4_ORYBR